MVTLLPQVAKQTCFALKGGTAINLFIRDMPRLSVDIDLAYLPVEDRQTSLTNIDKALAAIATDIEQHVAGANVNASLLEGTGKRYNMSRLPRNYPAAKNRENINRHIKWL
jgi:hypothetical protein